MLEVGVDVKWSDTHTDTHTPLAVLSGITPLLPLGIHTVAAIWLIITGRDGGGYKQKLPQIMIYHKSAVHFVRRQDTATRRATLG